MKIQEGEERIIGHFSQGFSDAEFMQMEELERKIKESGVKAENKAVMLELSTQFQCIQSVDEALTKVQKAGFDTSEVLERFENLGISPSPLRKNLCAKRLPGPVELLQNVLDEK